MITIIIKAIAQHRLQTFFGAANERSLQTSCGYLLFYQARSVSQASSATAAKKPKPSSSSAGDVGSGEKDAAQ
jgi:hypothetical protein